MESEPSTEAVQRAYRLPSGTQRLYVEARKRREAQEQALIEEKRLQLFGSVAVNLQPQVDRQG